jgi:D-inositol-3-phosphate glycosyltransferase
MQKTGPILILGPVSQPYSYARIIRSLVRRLLDRYEFHQFALDASSPLSGHEHPIYHNAVPGDAYGVEQLVALISRLRPKILWIINDMWLYFAHMDRLREQARDVRVVLYTPIDGTNLNPLHARALAGVSRLVLFNQFAKHVFENAVKQLRQVEGGSPSRFPEIALIPHGDDTEVFHPLEQRMAEAGVGDRRFVRRVLFPGQTELEDAFIVLNANQNNRRKRIDLTIEGFARFAG